MRSSLNSDMTFLGHLEELRWMLIKCLAAVVLLAVPCAVFWKDIFDRLMIFPLRFTAPNPMIIYTSPTDSVVLSMKIAIAGGVVLAAPVLFYQIWKFFSPALFLKEKRLILSVVAASVFCFLAGISFSYFTLPFVLKFLVAFAADNLSPMFRAEEYLGFLLKISLAFGLVFELPVISFVLARIGVLKHDFMVRNFSYAVVFMFIFAAVLTPPDIFSQLLLALPLLFLYGISIVIVAIVGRKHP